MKKIKPIERYDQDPQYPTTAEVEAEVATEVEARSGRRFFLKGLLVGAAAVGVGLLPRGEAQARAGAGPGPRIPPPGVPPLPDRRLRPRPRDTPPLPGEAPSPTPTSNPDPRPTKRPCKVGDSDTVTLSVLFTFCDGKTGRVVVTTTDSGVAANLRRPSEGSRLAPVIKPVFARESSCAWLHHAAQRAQVEARLAQALTHAYQQSLGSEIQPLKVSLVVGSKHPMPPPPGLPPRPVPPLAGVPPRPSRGKGCASCSTDASVQDVLLPAGLVALALVALKNRGQ